MPHEIPTRKFFLHHHHPIVILPNDHCLTTPITEPIIPKSHQHALLAIIRIFKFIQHQAKELLQHEREAK